MKSFILIAIIHSICSVGFSFVPPNEFVVSDLIKGSDRLYLNRTSGETIQSIGNVGVNLVFSDKVAVELQKMSTSKAAVLSEIVGIKNWKIISNESVSPVKGRHQIYIFGSYNDSRGSLIKFAEVYDFVSGKETKSYLLTRTSNSWSSGEIRKRFRIGESL